MYTIPLERVPSQEFNIVLENQNCKIKVYQRGEYMYMDLSVDNKLIRSGMICLVEHPILSYPTNKFMGYLGFIDNRNSNGIPNWKEFEERYILVYVNKNGE